MEYFDEDLEDLHLSFQVQPSRYYPRDSTDPFVALNDKQFHDRFRLMKHTVYDLLLVIEKHLEFTSDRNSSVPPIRQLLICLRFYASGTFQIVIGDTSDISKSTVCRIIKRVSHVLASLSPLYMKFPSTQDEKQRTMLGFYDIAGFPGVIGAIDCTHVAIQSPGGNTAELFRNRKGYFSINVQCVCDADLRITDIVARWPGATHDATIFDSSRIRAHLETNLGGHLLGDAGYPCRPYLLTPLAAPNSVAEKRYQNKHVATRNTVERLFGVWKRRFPVLKMGLRLKIDTALAVIVATAVLHNIAQQKDNCMPDICESVVEHESVDVVWNGPLEPGATSARAQIIANFARSRDDLQQLLPEW
ncbi:putative nuclease HARBI1 [Ornithodoros turicata]|uniref:putative nuclease HARBI1 n=1 Tax=Ornithodoros turicata TaxID=34597 RepID=UPI00313A2A10